jgi:hypothetical protein
MEDKETLEQILYMVEKDRVGYRYLRYRGISGDIPRGSEH